MASATKPPAGSARVTPATTVTGVDTIRTTRQLRVGSHPIGISGEHLDVRGRRERRVREIHREGVRLECQQPTRYVRRGIIDWPADGTANFVTQLRYAARVISLDVHGVADFDADGVSAGVVVSGVAYTVQVDYRYRVDLSRCLNGYRNAWTDSSLTERISQEGRDRERPR